MILFGIIPAAMAWSQRYLKGSPSSIPDLIPGGPLTLSCVMGFAGLVIVYELVTQVTSH